MRPAPSAAPSTGSRRARRVLARAALAILAAGAAAALLEGLASLILFSRDLRRGAAVSERRHTQYDPEIGWVSRPNVDLPDLYGPGIGLHTNAFGDRGRATASLPAAGTIRVACSGASFVLGYGVADDDTWSARLAADDANVETVNLGQGGYGFDQTYLWWRRQAARVHADVHVLAVTLNDFDRLGRTSIQGYPKPVLRLLEDRLAVEGTPVPAATFRFTWLPNLRVALGRLRIAELGTNLAAGGEGPVVSSPADLGPVAQRILVETLALDSRQGTRLVLVFLPRLGEGNHEAALPWRNFLRDTAAQLGIAYRDLVPALRALPRAEQLTLYRLTDPPGVIGAQGHYTVAGNEWAARQILPALRLNRADREPPLPPAARPSSPDR